MKRPYFSSCVNWPRDRLAVLEALQDEAGEISLEDFERKVSLEDWRRLKTGLGYALSRQNGIRIEDDWHVGYRMHIPTGIPFLVHSAIEYVFADPSEIDALQLSLDANANLAMEMEP